MDCTCFLFNLSPWCFSTTSLIHISAFSLPNFEKKMHQDNSGFSISPRILDMQVPEEPGIEPLFQWVDKPLYLLSRSHPQKLLSKKKKPFKVAEEVNSRRRVRVHVRVKLTKCWRPHSTTRDVWRGMNNVTEVKMTDKRRTARRDKWDEQFLQQV